MQKVGPTCDSILSCFHPFFKLILDLSLQQRAESVNIHVVFVVKVIRGLLNVFVDCLDFWTSVNVIVIVTFKNVEDHLSLNDPGFSISYSVILKLYSCFGKKSLAQIKLIVNWWLIVNFELNVLHIQKRIIILLIIEWNSPSSS